MLGSDRYITLSWVGPYLKIVEDSLQSSPHDTKLLDDLKTALRESYKQRFDAYLAGDSVQMLATALDPSTKEEFKVSDATWKHLIEAVEVRRDMEQSELQHITAGGLSSTPASQLLLSSASSSFQAKRLKSANPLKQHLQQHRQGSEPSPLTQIAASVKPLTVEQQVSAFKTERSQLQPGDFFDTPRYWIDKVAIWPSLARLAINILSMPATEVRIFRCYCSRCCSCQ